MTPRGKDRQVTAQARVSPYRSGLLSDMNVIESPPNATKRAVVLPNWVCCPVRNQFSLCEVAEIDRVSGLVLYGTSRASSDSKDLATPRIANSLQIRRTIGRVVDRRQCRSSPYCRSVDSAIIYIFAGSGQKRSEHNRWKCPARMHWSRRSEGRRRMSSSVFLEVP